MNSSAAFVPLPPTIRGPEATTRPPRVRFPAGACDCHAHIFGPQREYPFAPSHGYVPPEASIDSYVQMLRILGCERAVIVQPSIYGGDNRCMLDALRSGKFAFRGVAAIDDQTTDAQLEDMHQAGVRGIRLNLKSKGATAALDSAARLAERIKARGWHLQFYLDVRDLPQIDQFLVTLPVNVVIDHFAHVAVEDGIAGASFQTLLRLARFDRCWFKLIGPYRISQQRPTFPDVTPLVRALLKAAPERCIWGTDWPHPNVEFMPNDGVLADLVPEWIPDEALRRRVLVDNPARLYDFS